MSERRHRYSPRRHHRPERSGTDGRTVSAVGTTPSAPPDTLRPESDQLGDEFARLDALTARLDLLETQIADFDPLPDAAPVIVDPQPASAPKPLLSPFTKMDRGTRRHVTAMVLAGVLWLVGAIGVAWTASGGYGLVEILPLTVFAALFILIVGFALAVTRHDSTIVPGAYTVLLTVFLHALPAVIYPLVRFSWAWKHIGIVDYILRFDAVDPTVAVDNVYHYWPGFFGVAAVATQSAGFDSAASFAAWAPLVFNLLSVLTLFTLYRSFTDDRRLIWTGIWLFVLANWVGQDYFAPQALAFFLYIVVLTILVRWFAKVPQPKPGKRIPMTGAAESLDRSSTAGIVLSGIVAVSMVAIAVSHQLTPVMLVVALIALTLFRVIKPVWPPVAMIIFTLMWMFGFARDFVASRLADILSSFGGLQANLETGVSNLAVASVAQTNVALTSRLLTVGVILLGGIGFLRLVRWVRVPKAAVVLGAAPAVIVVLSPYGGEGLFRAYLFALPFVVFFGAALWFPVRVVGRKWITAVGLVLLSVVMLGAFLVAEFGADERQVFTAQELEGARYVYEHGAPGSLLVQGSRDYPTQFTNYENFVYVTLDRSYPHTLGRLADDPTGTLVEWMTDPQYTDGFILITRSQLASVERLGTMITPSLPFVVEALEESDQFEVAFENDDAVVFVLADGVTR